MNSTPHCLKCGSSYGIHRICPYCGTRNDIDLYIDLITIIESETDLQCPECEVPFQKVSISNQNLLRCPQCYLKLTTRGSIKSIVGQKLSQVYTVNRTKLSTLSNSNFQATNPALVKCPCCKELMHRAPLRSEERRVG